MADEQNENESERGDDTLDGAEDAPQASDDAAAASPDVDTASSDVDTASSDDDAASSDDEPDDAVPTTAKASGATSAGARLAAAKAVKAARKSAAKAARAAERAAAEGDPSGGGAVSTNDEPAVDPVEAARDTAVGRAAIRAGEWAQSHRQLAMGAAAAAVLAAAGWFGFQAFDGAKRRDAGAALATAVETANAEIRGAGESGAADDDAPTFESAQARAEAALSAYRAVVAAHAGTDAAHWARLGEARALSDLERFADARTAYETALREGGSDPAIAWRALEGIGFTHEAESHWQEAISSYEDLRAVDSGAFTAAADYHIARMHMRMGQTTEATTELRALVERVQTSDEGAEPAFPYVLAQAQIRLRELDPSAAPEAPSPMGPGGPGGGGGMPAGLDGLPPEILEQLQRQLAAQGAQPAPGGPAPMPAPAPSGGAGEGE